MPSDDDLSPAPKRKASAGRTEHSRPEPHVQHAMGAATDTQLDALSVLTSDSETDSSAAFEEVADLAGAARGPTASAPVSAVHPWSWMMHVQPEPAAATEAKVAFQADSDIVASAAPPDRAVLSAELFKQRAPAAKSATCAIL